LSDYIGYGSETARVILRASRVITVVICASGRNRLVYVGFFLEKIVFHKRVA